MALVSGGAKTVGLIVAMLLLGSYNTISTKLQLESCHPNADTASLQPDGHRGCPMGQRKYTKPWLINMYMFVGEASLMVVYSVTGRHSGTRENVQGAAETTTAPRFLCATEQRLLAPAPRPTPFYIFAIPALCDVFGTGLATVGMQYMDSAIWQMLRSSIIIFSAILSACFLKRKLQPFHWLASGIVFVGLVIVGFASSLDRSSDNKAAARSERILGLVLVIGAQLCSAFQMVFEEKLLTGRVKTSAKKVVGMEGLWGGFFMVIILTLLTSLPGMDNGSYESAPHGLYTLVHSPMLLTLVPTYMCSIAAYNLTGITVGKRMSAVVRCLVDSCRTVVVWTVNLFIFYCVSERSGFSGWMPHSWLTLLGFLMLVFGTLLYNAVLPVPIWLMRPQPEGSIARDTLWLDDVQRKVDHAEHVEITPSMKETPSWA